MVEALSSKKLPRRLLKALVRLTQNTFHIKIVLYKVQQARIQVSVILMMTVKRKLLMMKMLMWFALTEDVSL